MRKVVVESVGNGDVRVSCTDDGCGWFQDFPSSSDWSLLTAAVEEHRALVRLPPHTADVLVLFGFPDGADVHGGLFWRTDGGRVMFYADCSDTFAWGSADAEEILEGDVPLLRECFADVSRHGVEWLLSVLFAARKRGTVPPDWWFRSEPDVPRALFDGAASG